MSNTPFKVVAFDSAYPGSMCEREHGGYVERDDANSLAAALLALVKSGDRATTDATERIAELESENAEAQELLRRAGERIPHSKFCAESGTSEHCPRCNIDAFLAKQGD